jgi:hypothetical protein
VRKCLSRFMIMEEAALSDYTIAQVEAWVPDRPDAAQMDRRASDGRLVLVAAVDGLFGGSRLAHEGR